MAIMDTSTQEWLEPPTLFGKLPRLGNISEVKNVMNYLCLRPHEYFVIGSANLVLRRIKEGTSNIDLMVALDVYDRMARYKHSQKHKPYQPTNQRGTENISVWVQNDNITLPVSANLAIVDDFYPMSFDSHLQHTELIEGVNCLTLDVVKATKEALQRPKDITDLRLIAAHLGETISLPTPTVINPVQES